MKQDKKIDRKQALKKMGKYAGLTALGTFMLLNPQKAQANSPEENKVEDEVHTPESDTDNSQSSVQGEEVDIEITDQQIEEYLQTIDSYRNLGQNYKAATSQYDEIIEAQKLCDLEELIALRKQLDDKCDIYQKQISRLANKLYRKLQLNSFWTIILLLWN